MTMAFTFEAELWQWDARQDSSWVFVTVPADVSAEISDMPRPGRGFGSVKVAVETGSSTWRTSVFPDTKTSCYVLPIKKAIRKAESIGIGDVVDFTVSLVVTE